MNVKITAELPYVFCKDCKLIYLKHTPIYANGKVELVVTSCTNAEICENAVELYKKGEG